MQRWKCGLLWPSAPLASGVRCSSMKPPVSKSSMTSSRPCGAPSRKPPTKSTNAALKWPISRTRRRTGRAGSSARRSSCSVQRNKRKCPRRTWETSNDRPSSSRRSRTRRKRVSRPSRRIRQPLKIRCSQSRRSFSKPSRRRPTSLPRSQARSASLATLRSGSSSSTTRRSDRRSSSIRPTFSCSSWSARSRAPRACGPYRSKWSSRSGSLSSLPSSTSRILRLRCSRPRASVWPTI
mmetsp:Transcript_10387/g.22057  ORF Transcript_10387/g.22057 Transcript_10387/m.22057 type:complete len:237 (-) Transcript_10387:857-1567(-)